MVAIGSTSKMWQIINMYDWIGLQHINKSKRHVSKLASFVAFISLINSWNNGTISIHNVETIASFFQSETIDGISVNSIFYKKNFPI